MRHYDKIRIGDVRTMNSERGEQPSDEEPSRLGMGLKVLLGVALCALLAAAIWLWRSLFPPIAELQLIELHAGTHDIAVQGTVRLPTGVRFGDDGLALSAFDEAGERFVVRALPARAEGLRFSIPTGYAGSEGRVTLELRAGDEVVGRVGLGSLPSTSQRFGVQPSNTVRAFFRDSSLVVQVKTPVHADDELLLRPLRTDHKIWSADVELPLKPVGPDLCEAELQGPHLLEATKLEFEVSERRYVPDQFVIKGAAIEGGALVVREAVCHSREGRRLHVPAQRARITTNGNVMLICESDSPENGWRPQPPELVAPRAQDLGLNNVSVWVRPKEPDAPGGGGGLGLPGTLRSWNSAEVRHGPTGDLRFAMSPRSAPAKVVTKYAVPIEGS